MDAVKIAKALADETRFRLLMALREGELCVCQLVAFVDLANATVSKHLFILRSAELITSRKEGRWMYYRIVEKPKPLVSQALKWAFGSWEKSFQAKADAQTLKKVCCQSPEELCQTLRKKNT